MNKTININLGGMFFHIDEDAYQKLSRYFDAIKRSLANSSGQDEIIKDIEMRIAELVTEKHTSDKQVITLSELDEIITVMGQPEDYRLDEEEPIASGSTFYSGSQTNTKKLYRDRDGGMIGGVLSGLSYYFGIDKVWLRILLLVLAIFYGTGFFAYIILWIVMPEAITTSEKLQMRGEPVTLANIEKKVRDGFDNVSSKFKNGEFDELGNKVKTGATRAAGSFGDFILTLLKIFAKFIGILLIITSIAVLCALLVSIFTIGSTHLIDVPWQAFAASESFSDYPLWILGLLFFFAVGIPFFMLMLLGFKLISPTIKSIGSVAKYTLLAVWLISIGILISLGIRQGTQFAVSGNLIDKKEVVLKENDTLYVGFRNNDYFTTLDLGNNGFSVTEDSTGTKVIYSKDVDVRFKPSNSAKTFIEIEFSSRAETLTQAKEKARKIRYTVSIIGNRILLDKYLLTDFADKFRNQEVDITIFVPNGIYIRPDENLRHFDYSDNDFFDLHYSGNYLYKVENRKVRCLDCPADENDRDDNDDEGDRDSKGFSISSDSDPNASITLNKDGILIKSGDTIRTEKEVKSVKINSEGVFIKTK